MQHREKKEIENMKSYKRDRDRMRNCKILLVCQSFLLGLVFFLLMYVLL